MICVIVLLLNPYFVEKLCASWIKLGISDSPYGKALDIHNMAQKIKKMYYFVCMFNFIILYIYERDCNKIQRSARFS